MARYGRRRVRANTIMRLEGGVEGRPVRCPLLWLGVFGNAEYQNARWERLVRTDLG